MVNIHTFNWFSYHETVNSIGLEVLYQVFLSKSSIKKTPTEVSVYNL